MQNIKKYKVRFISDWPLYNICICLVKENANFHLVNDKAKRNKNSCKKKIDNYDNEIIKIIQVQYFLIADPVWKLNKWSRKMERLCNPCAWPNITKCTEYIDDQGQTVTSKLFLIELHRAIISSLLTIIRYISKYSKRSILREILATWSKDL